MVALTPAGLLRITKTGDAGELLVARADLPADPRLVGIPGAGPAVVSGAVEGGRALWVVRGPEADGPGRLRPLMAEGQQALVPPGGEVLCSPWSSHVAFEGPEGWEAWAVTPSADPPVAVRVVARDCRGWGALFAPDGERLIVPGKVDGLWQVSLQDGRLSYMADGNFGASRRLRHLRAFHRKPDRLVGAEWSRNGVLHIFTTHLGGGGKYQFKVGFTHDYSAALSWDGNLMVYCQSSFDEDSDEPFDEAIWCLDQTTPGAAAVFVDDRRAGQSDAGPSFIGRSDAFVYVADGEVRGVVFHRPSLETPP